MNDDLRDLLDPADDARVAAALHRIRADLVVAPDEVTAARHRRQRRALSAPPAGRRVAVAVFLAVAGTGAALHAVAPPTTTSLPAGESLDPADGDPDAPVIEFAPPRPGSAPALPSYVVPLPVPAETSVVPPRPADDAARADSTDERPTPPLDPGSASDPAPDRAEQGRRPARPEPAHTPAPPPTPPSAPSTPGEGRTDDRRPADGGGDQQPAAPADPATDAPADPDPAADQGADSARDGVAAPTGR